MTSFMPPFPWRRRPVQSSGHANPLGDEVFKEPGRDEEVEAEDFPVPTECNATLFEFAPVDGCRVVAAFDGGAITSDAGALLLGETDRAIR
jgi:hypothetical protein